MHAGLLAAGLFALLPIAAATAATADTEIPAAFRGHWAPTLQDCRDVDGVNSLTLDQRGFHFYEARSDAASFQVEPVSPRKIRIRTGVSGEGKQSAAVMDFELSADQQALTWRGFGRDPEKNHHDMRCPS